MNRLYGISLILYCLDRVGVVELQRHVHVAACGRHSLKAAPAVCPIPVLLTLSCLGLSSSFYIPILRNTITPTTTSLDVDLQIREITVNGHSLTIPAENCRCHRASRANREPVVNIRPTHQLTALSGLQVPVCRKTRKLALSQYQFPPKNQTKARQCEIRNLRNSFFTSC
jgi:hypothetical protein